MKLIEGTYENLITNGLQQDMHEAVADDNKIPIKRFFKKMQKILMK